jgi:hypothetical protein
MYKLIFQLIYEIIYTMIETVSINYPYMFFAMTIRV